MQQVPLCCGNCHWWNRLATSRSRKTCREKGWLSHHKCRDFLVEDNVLNALIEAEPVEEIGELLRCSRCPGLKWEHGEEAVAAQRGQSVGDYIRVYREGSCLRDLLNGTQLGTLVNGEAVCFRCKP